MQVLSVVVPTRLDFQNEVYIFGIFTVCLITGVVIFCKSSSVLIQALFTSAVLSVIWLTPFRSWENIYHYNLWRYQIKCNYFGWPVLGWEWPARASVVIKVISVVNINYHTNHFLNWIGQYWLIDSSFYVLLKNFSLV
jgi:hypothetical protein